ncbi:MAG: hypothetical protein WCF07_13765 [Nitrososphaeraceae archaeon]
MRIKEVVCLLALAISFIEPKSLAQFWATNGGLGNKLVPSDPFKSVGRSRGTDKTLLQLTVYTITSLLWIKIS